jgi:transcriptional regulator with XRE-family HTH domain
MDNLKQWRLDHNLSQKQAAGMVYISVRQWQRVESQPTALHASWKALLTLRTDDSANFRAQVERKLKSI